MMKSSPTLSDDMASIPMPSTTPAAPSLTKTPKRYLPRLSLPIYFAPIATAAVLQSMMMPAYAANNSRVLMIEMTPALCSMQSSRARLRQCLEGYSLTVSGLDLSYGSSCKSRSEPRLTPLQLKVVNRIMPDSTIRTQAWQRYGACSPYSSSTYFRQIVNMASELELPRELNTGNSYTVSKSSFVNQMTRLNPGMRAGSLDLICQDGNRRQSVLTQVRVCYDGNSFGQCENVIDNCGNNFIISGGK